jgi:hypothetical protein
MDATLLLHAWLLKALGALEEDKHLHDLIDPCMSTACLAIRVTMMVTHVPHCWVFSVSCFVVLFRHLRWDDGNVLVTSRFNLGRFNTCPGFAAH